MMGEPDNPEIKGIMPRSFEDIFASIKLDSDQTQFLVRASYLEIYNEEIRDLLSKNPKNKLDLHEKTDTGVYVKGLSFFAAKTSDEIRKIMHIGSKNRSVGATAMNEQSSRSHSLFQITVERSELGADGKQHIRVGKLNMVDLAGSERLAKTHATGDRLKEATKINLSLSTLCHVISSLIDPKATYIPYRDSKLTRMLQDSLGGNTKTVMIANVGPSEYNYDETINTLRYASRAKSIKNKPRINEDPKDALLREYQEEISKLKEQLNALNSGMKPEEIMKKHGVIGNNVVEQEVFVEDKEKMAEFEERLRIEKEEMKQQAEVARAQIENQANLQQEEKQKLIEELQKTEQEKEKAHKKQQHLVKKLQKMKEKMLVGDQVKEVAKKQKKELKVIRKNMEREAQKAAEMQMKLEEEEKMIAKATAQYTNVAEELEAKTKMLEYMWEELQQANKDLGEVNEDFDRERNDMYDTIYELTNQLKLKNMIIEYMVPLDEYRKYEKIAEWNEDINDWTIKNPSNYKDIKTGTKRPQSAVGMKRPTSEYSRIAKGLGDLNPRYKFDNILQLDLDMPERTTEDYEGIPSAKVQQAIQAILNDNDIKQDNIPITTLINFNDSCLLEGPVQASQVPSNRPRSSKRPKSSKKKKAA